MMLPSLKQPGTAPPEKVEVYVTYKEVPHRTEDRALAELRRSMGMTQREAALVLEVALNTWARWERANSGSIRNELARCVACADSCSNTARDRCGGWASMDYVTCSMGRPSQRLSPRAAWMLVVLHRAQTQQGIPRD
jgi:DNA-binding XRE family transcriptional regulator